jgi:alanine-synthesizing transaminase
MPVSKRVAGFSYAIRNIVAEAKKVEEAGKRVRYLNIGDPIVFGFQTPPHLVAAVERAIRDGHNGYGPSPGIASARESVAADYSQRGWPISADRVLCTSGASEGIELALAALVDPGNEVLVPSPTYPLYTAVLAKLGGRPVFYPTDPSNGWQPNFDQLGPLISRTTRAIVVINPNNPTGAVYSNEAQKRLLNLADRYGLVVLSDEVYAELSYDRPTPPLGSLDPSAPVIGFGSLSKGYLAPGWRSGWIAVGGTGRLDGVLAAIKKLADGRLCSPVPMQHAISAAVSGDRSHQQAFRTALRERAEITTERLNAISGMSCIAPLGAFYAMPRVSLPPGKTDEQFVLELLRATGILCVYGSGFGLAAKDGYFRVVFLASPAELGAIYDEMQAFTQKFLSSGGRAPKGR